MARSRGVGDPIDGWCTRCRLVLAHTIEAKVGERITRVHCNTCKSQHAYRPDAPGARRAASPRSTGPRSAKPVLAERYAESMRGRDVSAARPYRPVEHFAVDEILRHPSFGVGLVTAEKDRTKIEVLFPDGPRTLIHAVR